MKESLDQQPSLEQVAESFRDWRKRKRYKSERVPGELVAQVKSLAHAGKHKKGELIRRLSLSDSLIRQVFGAKKENRDESSISDGFIRLH